MKIKRKHCPKWFLCPLLFFLLALCTMAAVPKTNGAARAVDFNKACSLNLVFSSGEFEEDLNKADVVIDLYKVADAKEVSGYDSYTYEFLDAYRSLTVSEHPDEEEWKKLARQAAEIALNGGVPMMTGVAKGEKISDLTGGLYLAVARGAKLSEYVVTAEDESGNKRLATKADSDEYTYTIAPALISLPGKEEGSGDWNYDITASFKLERNTRYGSLEIIKTLQSYETKDPATFVFSVEAELGGQIVFSDVVSLSFTAPGQKQTLLTKIPVGANVTVTEIYSGAVYQPQTDVTQTTVISADETVSVSFTNDYDDTYKGGGAVVNEFEYHSDTGWGWTKINDKE